MAQERERPWWDNTVFRFVAVMAVIFLVLYVVSRQGIW
jgi:hypothetical protein